MDLFFVFLASLLGIMAWHNKIEYVPATFGLEYDYSIANIYNFFKWIAVAFMLFALWTHSHQFIHAVLSIIFTIVFIDDAFEVHEKINSATANIIGIPAHYAGAILLIFLSAAAGILVRAVWNKSKKKSQLQARMILILMGCLVLFGGGLDTIQSNFSGNLAYAIGVIEDGVELVIASLVLISSREFLEDAINYRGII